VELYDQAFVDRFLAPWNRHDVDGAMALMTDDCVWEIPRGSEPHGTLFKGTTAVRTAIADAFKTVPNVHYEPIRGHYGKDHVVVELLVTGTHVDGTQLKFHACDILTLTSGKIAAKRSYRKVLV
jgi:ketosteroid isomerase-like protein